MTVGDGWLGVRWGAAHRAVQSAGATRAASMMRFRPNRLLALLAKSEWFRTAPDLHSTSLLGETVGE
eukprot:3944052-Prymnesium_polylepis.1